MKNSRIALTAFVIATGALVSSGTGCELIAAVDRGRVHGEGGGGAGGAGGTTTTSSSSTTTSVTGGTGGTGGDTGSTSSTSTSSTSTSSTSTSSTSTTTPPPTCGTPGGTTCLVAGDCPAAGLCFHTTCGADNCCGTQADANGITAPTAQQIPGDCQVVVCDGNGGTTSIPDDADAPADANDCSVGACVNGVPAQSPRLQGASCTSSGGSFCDGAGACIECLDAAGCTDPTKPVCNASHACVAATCTDGLQSGFETDVDCGGGAGSGCSTCADGKHCVQASDCGASSICKAGVCTAVSCTDGVKDGAETDVDCGGTACVTLGNKCAAGKGCAAASDCGSGYCNATTKLCATPTCADGVQNGAESDVDCGGACATKCALTQKCGADSDCGSGYCNPTTKVCGQLADGGACSSAGMCQSGFCVDGVCCASACSGSCEACSLALNGGSDGACLPIPNGQDPDGECAAQPASSCGTTGTCNGARACALHASGTVCVAQSCAGTVQTNAQLCDGTGACQASTTTSCAPYACNAGGTGCLSSCSLDTDCAATNICNAAGHCAAPLANGAACAVDHECAGGHCYVTGGGAGQATCHADLCADGVKDGAETDVDCGGACGACAQGKLCSTDVGCATAHCVDGVCCDTACNGECQACAAPLKESGAGTGTCGASKAGADPHAVCATTCGNSLTAFGGAQTATWNLNGNATYDATAGTVVLTQELASQKGSVIYQHGLATDSFTVQFDFRLTTVSTNDGGPSFGRADGMAFFIQTNGNNAVGNGGGGLGVSGLSGYAVELDLYDNGACGEGGNGNHAGIDTLAVCGTQSQPTAVATSPDLFAAVGDIGDGAFRTATVTVLNGQASVSINGAAISALQGVTLPGLAAGTKYFFGFAGANGATMTARQEIKNVSITFPTNRCL